MATDFKITSIQKILTLEDELRHIHIQVVFTDGVITKEYGTDLTSEKDPDLVNEIEKWLTIKKFDFEEFASLKSVVEVFGDHKIQTLDASLYLIDKDKIINAAKP